MNDEHKTPETMITPDTEPSQPPLPKEPSKEIIPDTPSLKLLRGCIIAIAVLIVGTFLLFGACMLMFSFN